jgi:hypothetical protein
VSSSVSPWPISGIRLTFWVFSGSPHATANTNDPWHASVALRRKDDFKGSGLSLHVYPDGTVVPSKPEFPVVHLRPATKEEVGNENSCWLDPQFVANWKASNEEHEGSADKKAKRKARPSDFSGYSTHPDTGDLYRYVENGAVVYLDPNTKKEYYYNEEGQPTWL